MASVNKVVLIGHLGKDPDIKYLQSGEPVANFSLATSEKWTDKSGEKQERTDWHRVEVFGKTAQVVRDYCQKGKQVYVEGQIRYDEWTDKDGNKKFMTKIRVSGFGGRIVLLGSGATKRDDNDATVAKDGKELGGVGPDDSLPF